MQISSNVRDDNTIVSIAGRLDSGTSAEAEKQLLALVERGARKIVLDCAGLEYVSSAGLRVMLAVAKRMGGLQGRLTLAAPAAQVREILDIAGFGDILPVFATVEEAL